MCKRGFWQISGDGYLQCFRRVFQFFRGRVNFEVIFRPSPATIGLPNRYNLVLQFPIFILIHYVSNLVKKQLSYEALKITQRVFNGMTKMMDGGQSQRPFLLIFNLRDQSDVLCIYL
ncbi:unnamed protein product [Malus baccata var. baccata]